MVAIWPSAWHIWQKESVRFEFQRISSRRIGEIKARIEESRKGHDEAMATLAECQRKLREGGPLVREGAEKTRQEALRFREEARKKNR